MTDFKAGVCMRPIGIYIHIPFCKSFCPYCDFYKVRADKELMEKYTEAVVERTASFSRTFNDACRGINVDTVYFGGGTPSVMSGEQIVRMLGGIRENFCVSDTAEITVECNPSSDLDSFIPLVADAGVNRISLGMQSSADEERRLLGRTSGKERVVSALDTSRRNGIENISLDVMIGIPKQTHDSLKETLEFCIGEGVKHVSSYMLKIEKNTVFDKRRDKLSLPDEDDACDFYIDTCSILEDAGVKQYEISNFAVPGYESRHNLKYWKCQEYLGIGPAAHSFINGKRFYFNRNIESFINGENYIADGDGGSYEEKLMLALRLRNGFSYAEGLKSETADRARDKKLAPFLELDEKGIRLNRDGFLLSNTIIAELLG